MVLALWIAVSTWAAVTWGTLCTVAWRALSTVAWRALGVAPAVVRLPAWLIDMRLLVFVCRQKRTVYV